MALTDLTRISTSGIATGSSLSGAILHGDAHFRGTQVGVTSALFDSSDDALEFNDNVKLTFGNDGDLKLYHNGSHSYIDETGMGNLYIRNGTKNSIWCKTGGQVNLYFNDVKKFETTNHGAIVTGILTATGFSGPLSNASGISTFYDLRVTNNLTVEGTTTTLDTNLIGVDRVEVGADSNTVVGVAITQSGTADIINLFDDSTEVLTVKANGRVGIGETNPDSNLHVYQTSTTPLTVEANGIYAATRYLQNGGTNFHSSVGGAVFGANNVGLSFKTGYNSAYERMIIDVDGRVSIGHTLPYPKIPQNHLNTLLTVGAGHSTHSYGLRSFARFTASGTYNGNDTSVIHLGEAVPNQDDPAITFMRRAGGASYNSHMAQIKLGYLGGPFGFQFLNSTAAQPGSHSLTPNMVISQTGKIGINTTDASHLFTVYAQSGSSTIARFKAFNGNSNFDIHTDGSSHGQAYVRNNIGATKVALNSSGDSYFTGGNVGIGEATPSQKLQVGGDGGDACLSLIRTNAASNNNAWGHVFFENSSDATLASISARRESAADDAYLTFSTQSTGNTNSEKLRITSGGNILPGTNNATNIGDGTTNFNSIWASTRFRGNDNVKLVLGNSQNLVIRHDGSNNIIGSPVADDLHIKSGTLDNDNQLIAAFVHSTNRVGIRTDNPTAQLHVRGNGVFTQQLGGTITNGLFLDAGDTGQGNRPDIILKGSGNAGLSQKAMQVYYDNGSTKAYHLRYDGGAYHGGNIGIGSESPGRPLTITAADARIRLQDSDTGGHAEIYTDNSHSLHFGADSSSSSGSSNILFEFNGTEALRIRESGGDILYGPGNHIVGASPGLINGLGSHNNANPASVMYGIDDGGGYNGMRVENFDDGTYNSQRIKFLTGKGGYSMATVRMSINENGYIGIGTDAATNGAKLEINSGTETNASNQYDGQNFSLVIRANKGHAANGEGNGICFAQKFSGSSDSIIRTGAIIGIKDSANGNYGGGLLFKTQAHGANAMVDVLRITSAGNVGINESTNINARLHVQHDALSEKILHATRYNDQGNDKPIFAVTETQMTGMTSSGLIIGNHNRDIHIGQVFDSSGNMDSSNNIGLRIRYEGQTELYPNVGGNTNTQFTFTNSASTPYIQVKTNNVSDGAAIYFGEDNSGAHIKFLTKRRSGAQNAGSLLSVLDLDPYGRILTASAGGSIKTYPLVSGASIGSSGDEIGQFNYHDMRAPQGDLGGWVLLGVDYHGAHPYPRKAYKITKHENGAQGTRVYQIWHDGDANFHYGGMWELKVNEWGSTNNKHESVHLRCVFGKRNDVSVLVQPDGNGLWLMPQTIWGRFFIRRAGWDDSMRTRGSDYCAVTNGAALADGTVMAGVGNSIPGRDYGGSNHTYFELFPFDGAGGSHTGGRYIEGGTNVDG